LAGHDEHTAPVHNLFASCAFSTTVLSESIGSASALKMATASYLRTNRLLVAVAHALADEHGIAEHLVHEAEQFGASTLADRAYLPSVAARAWRWEAAAGKIPEPLARPGIPPTRPRASGERYRRLQGRRD